MANTSFSPTQANIETLVAALKVLDASGARASTTGSEHIGEPTSRPPSEMKLSELIEALGRMGINIISPHEMLNREQVAMDAEIAAQEAKNELEEAAAFEEAALEEAQRRAELRAQIALRAPTRRFIVEEAFKRVEQRGLTTTGARVPLSAVPSDVDSLDIESISSIGSSDVGNLTAIVGASSKPAATVSGLGKSPQAVPVIAGVTPSTPAAASGNVAGADGSNAIHTPAADEEALKGFVCVACNTHNLLRPAKGSWYAVTHGRKVGVFCDWTTVQPLVTGLSHACFKRYPSEAAATKAFQEAVALGHVIY